MPQPAPETLYALGLPRWRLRARAGSGVGEIAQAAGGAAAVMHSESAGASSGAGVAAPSAISAEVAQPGSAPAHASDAKAASASAGLAAHARLDAATTPAATAPATPAGGRDVAETLEALRAEVAGCQACALAGGRTQTVFGNGDPRARWMFIGEAPGRDEDARGEPFVGKAGRLLGAMLNALGLTREAVYVANVVKCRPPHNRDPEAAERAACRGYLDAQIRAVQPELVIALGRVAAASLLDTDAALGTLRGRTHTLPGSELPVVVTYHPAYLLRQPVHKARVWEDLLRARQLVAPEAASSAGEGAP